MISVRPAAAGDDQVLTTLRARAMAEASDKKGGPALIEDLPGDVSCGPDVLLGCIGEVPVAYVRIELSGRRGRVAELFCEPPARGVGVGDALLDAACALLLARGADRVDSVALPGDRGTKNFFEAHHMVARAITTSRAL